MKKIVAFGNPLLDTSVYVTDNDLLDKYNIKEDCQKEITSSEMKNLSLDILRYERYNTAGGCAQNSLRVLQWLLKKQCDAIIFGSVGKDEEAELLKKLLNHDGVKTKYLIQDEPTGKTVAIINSLNRTLVAYIGAAEVFPLSDLLAQQDFEILVLESDFVYIEGFFLTKRTNAAKYILNYCNRHNKLVIFNISGEYVCDVCPEAVEYFTKNSDIVFGNKREFETLRKIMKFDSISSLTQYLIENAKNKMDEYGKIIVITDGSNPGRCIYRLGKVHFDVPHISKKDIKDTTGAGDAFTGGFIAGLCKNKAVEDCARIGCYAAHYIIQQTGCSIPQFEANLL